LFGQILDGVFGSDLPAQVFFDGGAMFGNP
jgi:hypothetical protein